MICKLADLSWDASRALERCDRASTVLAASLVSENDSYYSPDKIPFKLGGKALIEDKVSRAPC